MGLKYQLIKGLASSEKPKDISQKAKEDKHAFLLVHSALHKIPDYKTDFMHMCAAAATSNSCWKLRFPQ